MEEKGLHANQTFRSCMHRLGDLGSASTHLCRQILPEGCSSARQLLTKRVAPKEETVADDANAPAVNEKASFLFSCNDGSR